MVAIRTVINDWRVRDQRRLYYERNESNSEKQISETGTPLAKRSLNGDIDWSDDFQSMTQFAN